MDSHDYIHNRIIELSTLSKNYTTDENGRRLNQRWAFIKLEKYVNEFLTGGINQNRFIVLSGLRGIGKTTLIMQLYEYLIEKKKVDKLNILYISMDEIKSFLGCSLAEVITAYLEQELKTTPIKLSTKTFIFVDEAHFDKQWNSTLKSLVDLSKNLFVIATGSSALQLDITTDSARRISREPLFPLSFAEYEILHRYKFYPPTGLSKDIRELILTGDATKISEINNKYAEVKKTYQQLKLNQETELIDFFEVGGFAFTINKNKRDSYSKLMDLIDRIIKTDLPAFRNFESTILTKVFRILGLIAIKKSGEISHTKLANTIETSPDTVNALLDTLEKTQLIFSIKPIHSSEGAKSWAGSPWKYYFLSPTLTYALRYTLGKTGFDEETKAILWENLVASTLFRQSKTISRQTSIFYDRQEGGVDFLLQDDTTGKITPIEVGLNKDKGQVESAIKRFNSKYGILISEFEKVFVENNVIHIPMKLFVFG